MLWAGVPEAALNNLVDSLLIKFVLNPNGLADPEEFDVVAAGWEDPPPKGFDIDDWKGFTFDWAGVEAGAEEGAENEEPKGLELEDPGSWLLKEFEEV